MRGPISNFEKSPSNYFFLVTSKKKKKTMFRGLYYPYKYMFINNFFFLIFKKYMFL